MNVFRRSNASGKGGRSSGPARISCDASYNTPCSRINSEWLATEVAKVLLAHDEAGYEPEEYLKNVTLGLYNYEQNFYPFVVDKETSLCVAHGSRPELVNRTISSIFSSLGVSFSSASALHARFVDAADAGGGWVRYFWREGGQIKPSSKAAYVTNLTSRFYIGVGYNDKQLPLDLPCSASYDSWCSINVVQSLVGKAQGILNKANLLDDFEDAIFRLSFDDSFQVPGGFFTFMYGYDGTLIAHSVLHQFFGLSLPEIVDKLGQSGNGTQLLHDFVLAAEGAGNGWVQYPWQNSDGELEFIKIFYIVKIEFGQEKYFLGSGFNFVVGDFMSGQMGEACSPKYNLPCAFNITSKLSSHSMAYAVSTEEPVSNVFEAVSMGEKAGFALGEFYLFFYDFNNTCVAHGGNPSFVAKTLMEVFRMVGIDLDAQLLHEKFRKAAYEGGGFVLYDWMIPGVNNSHFEKISRLFHVHLDGRDYYGGIGFAHSQAPNRTYVEARATMDGSGIKCSRKFGSKCSEVNSLAIVGEALTNLIMATEARVTASNRQHHQLSHVLTEITSKKGSYRINDFFVAVFSDDESLCFNDGDKYPDASGCCVAHGDKKEYVGKTWQEILDMEKITAIRGYHLHNLLVAQSDAGGGWLNYSWSQDAGVARTKRAWASRFRHNNTKYYVLVEYFNTDVPPTCEKKCPPGMGCIRGDQEFCIPVTKPDGLIIALAVLFSVGSLVALILWKKHNKEKQKRKEERRLRNELREAMELEREAMKRQNEELTKQLNQQMKGMVKVTRSMSASDYPPLPENVDQDGESLLPSMKNQIIQISKHHEGGQWSYGHVLFDPLLKDASKQHDTISSSEGLSAYFAESLHGRAMSGWFPDAITERANAVDMKEILDALGGEGVDSIKAPQSWERNVTSTTGVDEGRFEVLEDTKDYRDVVDYFEKSLNSLTGKVTVLRVERVQNLPLWQSYAVKRQSIRTRYNNSASPPYHNVDVNCIERSLFHGTSATNVDKIVMQGFDKAFAGSANAVQFGRGVYFARDSEYSCNPTYSKPDDDGVQRVFLCLVAVGDWCKGRRGQLTPDSKPNNRLELFDSTVDAIVNPTKFVIYRDSQVYPEYLISFRKNG